MLCEEHEPPRAPAVLLALTAPRRRWKLGALEGILNKRPTVEQEFITKRARMELAEYNVIRMLLANAEASKAANDYETPWEKAWKAKMHADASARPLRKRKRIESDDEC